MKRKSLRVQSILLLIFTCLPLRAIAEEVQATSPFILRTIPLSQGEHWARLWWANFDGDWSPASDDEDYTFAANSYDFIAAGFATNRPPGLQPVTGIYRNTYSDGLVPAADSVFGVDAINSPDSGAWLDFDNDGRPDFVVSGVTNALSPTPAIVLWRNTPSGFVHVATDFPSLDHASIVPGDFDNDGLVDLLITGRPPCLCLPPVVQLWQNMGTGSFSNVPIALKGLTSQAVTTGDFDRDGFLDIAISGLDGADYVTQVWRNGHNGDFILSTAALPGFAGILKAADFDNDGWLDLLIGGYNQDPVVNEDDAEIYAHVFRNNHDWTFKREIDIPDLIPQSASVGDYDNDGYLDVAMNGFDESLEDGAGEDVTRIFRNESGGAFAVVQSFLERENSSLASVDFDGDGKLDLSSSGLAGEDWALELLENTTLNGNAPPGPPTNLAATIVSDGVWLSWSPATDDHTPQSSLTYNVRIMQSQGSERPQIVTVSPLSSSNGFRLVAEPGNAGQRTNYFIRLPEPTGPYSGASALYYWSVQAVDGAYRGGRSLKKHASYFTQHPVSTL